MKRETQLVERISGKELWNKIHCCIRIQFLGVIIALVVILIFAWVLDRALEVNSAMVCKLGKLQDSLYEWVETLSTIVTAVVVFFYSVMDNKRLGIPHRSIVSYMAGSLTVPILFMMILFDMFFQKFLNNAKWNFLGCVNASCLFVLEIIIVGLVLASSSFRVYVRVLRSVEMSQLKYLTLCEIENKQYAWTYIVSHMEQAARGEDIFADKAIMMKDIMKAPFVLYEKKFDKQKYSAWQAFQSKWYHNIYEYYYYNLTTLFKLLKKQEEEENRWYSVILEFVNNETGKMKNRLNYKTYDQEIEENILVNSAILNAIMISKIERAEELCNYILNQCLYEEVIRRRQLELYILFQELLFAIFPENVQLKRVCELKLPQADMFQKLDKEDWIFYSKCWNIWTSQFSISSKASLKIFLDAIDTLQSEVEVSAPIMYMKYILKGRVK